MVVIVRWFEPSSESDNVNKFLVAYDDGAIYVFYTNQDSKAEKDPETIKINVSG